jgi:hypothetical protein
MRQGAIFCPTQARRKGCGLAGGPSLHDCKMSKSSAFDRAHIVTITLFAGNANYFVEYFVIGQSSLVGTPRCGVRTAQRAVPTFHGAPSLRHYNIFGAAADGAKRRAAGRTAARASAQPSNDRPLTMATQESAS